MKFNITVPPGTNTEEKGMVINSEEFKPYTGAYIGAHTYCWNMMLDNGIEFERGNGSLFHNVQIGNFNSIAEGLSIHLGRNHNIKKVETGALEVFFKQRNIVQSNEDSSFNQKGSVIIQNDVWIGANVTIVPNVIVRNGAVIARNSHVVSDVPPYAIVGGNPARVIGYRYPKELVEKLQVIQWWYWDQEKIIENAEYFNEDVERFCNEFFPEANEAFKLELEKRDINQDAYFAFVDWYEAYSSYPFILKQFLKKYADRKDKKLILYVLEDKKTGQIDNELYQRLKGIITFSNNSEEVLCTIDFRTGTIGDAKSVFLNCSHYVIARTYYAVMFSCLADKHNIEIISGVDSNIQFEKQRNMCKKDEKQ